MPGVSQVKDKVVRYLLPFLQVWILGFFLAVFVWVLRRGSLYGGFDGVYHLSIIQAQIESFRHWEGAASFSSMGRYIGHGAPLQGYQLFYWLVGLFGAILHLGAFHSLLVFLAALPFLTFLLTLFCLPMIKEKQLRWICAFFYGASPLLLGLCYESASWAMVLSMSLLPLLLRGVWSLFHMGSIFFIFFGFSMVLAAHPLTAVLVFPSISVAVLISLWRNRGLRSSSILFKLIIACSLVIGSSCYLIADFIDLKLKPQTSSEYKEQKIPLQSPADREAEIRQMMKLVGEPENASHFAQIYKWPFTLPLWSLGLAGSLACFGAFVGLVLCFRWRAGMERVFYLWLAGFASGYTLVLLPLNEVQVQLKIILSRWFDVIPILFLGRFLPLAMIFALIAFILLIESFWEKKIAWVSLIFLLFVQTLQNIQALKIAPSDMDKNTEKPSGHLTSFLYTNLPPHLQEKIITPEEVVPRPSTRAFMQPTRLWAWRTQSQKRAQNWESLTWNSSPVFSIFPPYNFYVQDQVQDPKELSPFSNGMISGFRIYHLPLPGLSRGVYQFLVNAEIEKKSGANQPIPFSMQMKIGSMMSSEAWLLPQLKQEAIAGRVVQKFTVPFEMDEDDQYPEFVLQPYSGFDTRLVSIEIKRLSLLPFEVKDHRQLSFELPRGFLDAGLEFQMPRFFMDGYTLEGRTESDHYYHIPTYLLGSGLLGASLPAVHEKISLSLKFKHPNFFREYRLTFFVFCVAILFIFAWIELKTVVLQRRSS